METKRGRDLKSIMKEGTAIDLKEFSKLDSRVLLKNTTWQNSKIQQVKDMLTFLDIYNRD